MASLNHCTFMGHLTRDPELKYTPKGTAVASFGIAMNHVYKNAAEEKMEEVCFVDCEAWGRTAEIAGEYLKKGDATLLVGRLKLDQWDDKQSGQKRSKHKLVIEELRLLGGNKGRQPDDKDDPRPAKPERPSTPAKPKDPDLDPVQEDDIPF